MRLTGAPILAVAVEKPPALKALEAPMKTAFVLLGHKPLSMMPDAGPG
jgi:hypothetical protein